MPDDRAPNLMTSNLFAPPARMTDEERAFLCAVQEDLPLVPRPFAEAAARLGISEEEVVRRIATFRNRKWIRRFAALLRHREAGYSHNAMVTWDVPAAECDAAGARAAAFPFVTHAYRRTRHAEWPYTLYAMVHARSAAECDERVGEVRAAVGDYPGATLLSTREFKKTSLRIDPRA